MTMAEALAAAVAGEDAAVYGYGVVAARTSNRDRALRNLKAHRAARDLLSSLASVRGVEVPAPAIAYELPFAVSGPRGAARLAAYLENGLVPVFADLAAAGEGEVRTSAVEQAQACAERAIRWGAAPQAFPQASARS